ncbi:MAG: radical SAM protein, partial [Firmicutes bacterium]|nr:radical SAM protein [Bacillota bacterium]
MTLSVYIHIPFCRSKCNYCDFTSFAHREDKYKDYKTELIKEINEFNNERNYTVTSIFIGGGTPSVLPASYIEEILEAVYKKFNMADNAEITIEANPESITAEKAFVYKNIGINRVSMGLQA